MFALRETRGFATLNEGGAGVFKRHTSRDERYFRRHRSAKLGCSLTPTRHSAADRRPKHIHTCIHTCMHTLIHTLHTLIHTYIDSYACIMYTNRHAHCVPTCVHGHAHSMYNKPYRQMRVWMCTYETVRTHEDTNTNVRASAPTEPIIIHHLFNARAPTFENSRHLRGHTHRGRRRNRGAACHARQPVL